MEVQRGRKAGAALKKQIVELQTQQDAKMAAMEVELVRERRLRADAEMERERLRVRLDLLTATMHQMQSEVSYHV